MNYFDSKTAAERYHHSRPAVHQELLEVIVDHYQLEVPVALALDVACGTGLSTLPLTEYAEQVVGMDVSPDMLAQAKAHSRITYQQGRAEELSGFTEQSVDLITLSSGFHWLEAARRVRRPGGYIVLYNNAFKGQVAEPINPAFRKWILDTYRAFLHATATPLKKLR